jgi:hypothetical protein
MDLLELPLDIISNIIAVAVAVTSGQIIDILWLRQVNRMNPSYPRRGASTNVLCSSSLRSQSHKTISQNPACGLAIAL